MVGKTLFIRLFYWFSKLALCVALCSPVLAQTAGETRTANSIYIGTDTDSIYLGDTLVLSIESIGLDEPLNIEPLFEQADFIRETTGTLISVIDGKVQEIAVRRLELIPRKTGALLIGPLTGTGLYGPIVSNAVPVDVQPALSADWVPEPQDMTLTAWFSNSEPYVGEQVELTIQLHHQYALAAESVTLPTFDGFDVQAVVEERRLIDNTTNRRSTTWRYLLHAQQSGEVLLPGPRWSATLIRSRTQRHDFELIHPDLALTVRPVPAQFPKNTWWIAAESLQLSDAWSSNLIEIAAGDEIIRTITLNTKGVLAHHLPIVTPLATRSFHSTPLPVTRDHKLIGKTTEAEGLYTFRMTAESPVSVFLDTVRVPWYNTRTGRIEEAIIPARRVDVRPPENPNQLAELAIKRHNINRWALWLKGVSLTHWLLLTAALLCVAVLVLMLQNGKLPQWLKYRTATAVNRLRWRYWIVTRQWQTLYDALLRTHCPFDDANSATQLKSCLAEYLYSAKDEGNEYRFNERVSSLCRKLTRSPYPALTQDTDHQTAHATQRATNATKPSVDVQNLPAI